LTEYGTRSAPPVSRNGPQPNFGRFLIDRAVRCFDTSVVVELSMSHLRFRGAARVTILPILIFFFCSTVQAQGARKTAPETPIADADTDHVRERAEWFLRGRVVPRKSSAELRHRAYQAKMRARASRLARVRAAEVDSQPAASSGGWTPLGPVPLASDATGDGFQNYNQVSGRATAVAIDPADPTGNTVYIGGAQGGVWKSTNAATSVANNVTWTAVTDDQATLSIGAIAIQPGNSNPAQSVVLVGTGEADNSGDSYFGLGILRSADGGNTWTLLTSANSGTYSFSGLGATRMAFSSAQSSTAVVAMAATSEGEIDGALTSNTYRGLYTSTDAGQSWTYNALFSGASETTSATSVVYNAAAGLFFAAVRYHGFYSSPDGLTWTRLANQPGAAGVLSTSACPQNFSTSCPIYRAEITVVPGRNEMYVWFVSVDSVGDPVDQGIWQSTTGGASWVALSDSGIIVCGDSYGCGVQQATYNLELMAVPNGTTATDLYAGTINIYKCSINVSNPTCAGTPFLNLTHVYGCSPVSALAHVHPDQHALAYMIPSSGAESGADLMYFANDGGIYRALNGFSGLTTGSCSGTNQFDDLNQNLGSMTQFVSFSQSPTDANTLLGGTQDNGSPATATATTSASWGNVLGGDGGYNAIDPNTGNWFASQPDPAPDSELAIQECSSGVNCNDSLFSVVVNGNDVGGDHGAFYFPYILDPQSTTTVLVGTCRVWSGPRLGGGAFTELSLNFDTLGIGTCAGNEVNTVRALAAGGSTNASGSQVIYATTDGLGPNFLSVLPAGGNVWVTTNAAAISGVSSTFKNVTLNGPGGNSINPSEFPISSIGIDTSDRTGNTAYATVMGFTGGPGHVWQTTNAGSSWTDWTDFGGAEPLPDSPANAVVVDPSTHTVYVGTDVGVFQSSTSAPAWTELGPTASNQQPGFLPNVAVSAIALFNSGGQKLLRASTYGRGVWQFNLAAAPDFQIAVSNTPLTVFVGTTATFNGTATAVDGFNNSVELSCTAGSSNPPSPCTPSPVSLTPTSTGAGFLITAGTGTVGNYNFNVQAIGSDPNNTTHSAAVALNVVSFALTAPTPGTLSEPPGAASTAVSFQATAQGAFNQSVTLSCSFSPSISGANCTFTPSAVVNPTSNSPVNMTASVIVPVGTTAGNYTVTLQATTPGAPGPVTTSFALVVTAAQDFTVNSSTASQTVAAGQTTGPYNLTVAPAGSAFSGVVTLSCSGIPPGALCNFTSNEIVPGNNSVNVVLTIATSGGAIGGSYNVMVTGTSGSLSHSITVTLALNGFQLAVSQPFPASADAGSQQSSKVSVTPSYSGSVNAACDAGAFSGQCTVTPGSPISIAAGTATNLTLTVNIPNSAAPQPSNPYNVNLTVTDSTGLPTQTLPMLLTVIQDFTLGSLTPATTQTITAGQSVSYNFNALPVGSTFASAVNLSCSGAPLISLCSFTPGSVTPGSNSAAVVLTISTTSNAASQPPFGPDRPVFSSAYALWLVLPALALLGAGRSRRKNARLALSASLLGLFMLALLLSSCGGGGSNGGSGGGGGGGQQQGTKPGTYTITVTGTSGTLSHTAPSVTLVVN
jgi:hypothetical protein